MKRSCPLSPSDAFTATREVSPGCVTHTTLQVCIRSTHLGKGLFHQSKKDLTELGATENQVAKKREEVRISELFLQSESMRPDRSSCLLWCTSFCRQPGDALACVFTLAVWESLQMMTTEQDDDDDVHDDDDDENAGSK